MWLTGATFRDLLPSGPRKESGPPVIKHGTGGFDGESLKGLVHHTLTCGGSSRCQGMEGPKQTESIFQGQSELAASSLVTGDSRAKALMDILSSGQKL